MKRNILVLSENFPPKSGGSGRWFWELYSRLTLDEDSKIIILSDNKPAGSMECTHSNFEVLRVPFSSSEWGFKSKTGLQFYWRNFLQVRKLVKKYNISQIHCGRVMHEGVIAWLVSLSTKIDYLCYIHGEDIETSAVSREHDIMVRQVCKRAKKLICNSKNSAQIAKRLNYTRDDNHTTVLNPGVDSKRFVPAQVDSAIRESLGWADRFVVLTVGRLQERKGHDKMIESIPAIVKKVPNFLYAVIGDGECKSALVKLVEKLDIAEHVTFMSEISDEKMIACYQHCDVFILPNRTIGNDIEGFGMVLVEAQSCAKPVIAGDSGGTKETLLEGETGFIVDCTQAQHISDKIIEMAGMQDELVVMGKKGREHVVEHLDWDAHVIKAANLFSKL